MKNPTKNDMDLEYAMETFYEYAILHTKAMQHMTEIHLNHPNATQIEDLREGRQNNDQLYLCDSLR